MNDNRALRRFLRNMGNGTIPEDWDAAEAMLDRIEQREKRYRLALEHISTFSSRYGPSDESVIASAALEEQP